MGDSLKVSVALCTFNGAQHIVEQLASIAAQTRLPDEVIICDDNSTDKTGELIRQFAVSAPFLVSFHRNPVQLGLAKNFERSISLCTGEVIFLCDQDDIWLPEKVALIVGQFQVNTGAQLVFSNGFITDSRLNKMGYTVWDTFKLNAAARTLLTGATALDFLIRNYAITGATMAFRASLRDQFIPIPDTWIHDAWISCLAAHHGSIVAIETPLIMYRQHEKNLIGGRKLSLSERFSRMRSITPSELILEISRWRALLDKLDTLPKTVGLAANLSEIRSKISHLREREAVFYVDVAERARIVACEILTKRYWKFSKGLSSAFTDLFLRRKVKV